MPQLIKKRRIERIHANLSMHKQWEKYSLSLTYDDKPEQLWVIAQNLALKAANEKFAHYIDFFEERERK